MLAIVPEPGWHGRTGFPATLHRCPATTSRSGTRQGRSSCTGHCARIGCPRRAAFAKHAGCCDTALGVTSMFLSPLPPPGPLLLSACGRLEVSPRRGPKSPAMGFVPRPRGFASCGPGSRKEPGGFRHRRRWCPKAAGSTNIIRGTPPKDDAASPRVASSMEVEASRLGAVVATGQLAGRESRTHRSCRLDSRT